MQQRALASSLTGVSMALGVMLVVAVLTAHAIISRSFSSGPSLPYNVVVGKPGGDLQMVLNAVYYMDRPVENLPYAYYEEFLPKKPDKKPPEQKPNAKLDDSFPAFKYRSDDRDGEFAEYCDAAIPVCLGDYYENFRVIGTTPQFFEDVGPPYNIHYAFAEGENFKQQNYFDIVIGSIVHNKTGLKVGDKIKLRHGSETGSLHGQEFTVAGVLGATGTPVDKGVFINMEDDFKLEGHVGGRKEVTAILIRLTGKFGLPELLSDSFIPLINKGKDARAVMPIGQIAKMFDQFINPLLAVLLVLAVLVVVVSGIGILVSIYNSMSERQHEIAVMRALGAGRSTVMRIVLLESILLALGGGLLGFFAGHVLIFATGPWITSLTGFPVGLLQSGTIYELILVPGLIGLAALVGFLPALSAYRTDVAKALTANP